MKQFTIILFTILTMLLIGCGGGPSTPTDDDNITEVKLTDLRLGYEVKGLLTFDIEDDIRYDLGFCNDELTLRIIYDSDLIDDHYGVGTYEIIGENILVYADGGAMIDTGDSGSFEEGKYYLIEGTKDNLDWRIGSISKKDCVVESI